MSESTEKMSIEITDDTPSEWGGKKWARATMRSKVWYPSFEDLFRLVEAVAICEDMKYPAGSGRGMVFAFLRRMGEQGYRPDYDSLAAEFKIPTRQRNGAAIAPTNGSDATKPLWAIVGRKNI